MSIEDAVAPWLAAQKAEVMTTTWGHLFPDPGFYEGVIRIANEDDSTHTIIDWKAEGIRDSPWFTEARCQFLMGLQEVPLGVVDYDVGIKVTEHDEWDEDIEANKTWRTIEIASFRQRVVLKPL